MIFDAVLGGDNFRTRTYGFLNEMDGRESSARRVGDKDDLVYDGRTKWWKLVYHLVFLTGGHILEAEASGKMISYLSYLFGYIDLKLSSMGPKT